jgi:DHA2 family multidrug resistance protein
MSRSQGPTERPADGNHTLVTIGILLAVFLNALDMTVVNVALPHMQGSLSASPEQITWVITSYVVGTAVATPVSGWVAARLGHKPTLLVCTAGFIAASVLCGLSATLPQMVMFRILQAATGAPISPIAQAVLLNITPPQRHARALALYTMSVVVAPIVGPVIGGFLTENYSWRWCFYVNVPAGLGAMLLIWTFLPRGAVLQRRFDFLGFGSLAVAIASFQLMLDRGPTQDWFYSREVCLEAIVAASAFWIYLVHTLTTEHPLFPPALARDRNFVTSVTINFFILMLMMCSLTLLPLMMQGPLGYPVIHAGVLSTPRGLVIMAVLQVMGRVDAMVDRRLLVALGLAFMVAGFWQMAHFDLSMGGGQIVFATVLQGIGQGIILVPIMTLGFATIRPELRADASAVSNLLRNLGGSVGVASIQAVTAVNSQAMHASLAAFIRPGDPMMRAMLPPAWSPGTAEGALALNQEITRQSLMVAYVDDFRLLALIGLCCAPLILLLRQPRRLQAIPTDGPTPRARSV